MAPHEKVLPECATNFQNHKDSIHDMKEDVIRIFKKVDDVNDKFNSIYWKLGILCGTMSALGAYLGKH